MDVNMLRRLGLRREAKRHAAFVQTKSLHTLLVSRALDSARGLAHSKTLARPSSACKLREASWSAAALRRSVRTNDILI
jgi:hypothetical protein